MLLSPQSSFNRSEYTIDYRSEASHITDASSAVIVPDLPDTWQANKAVFAPSSPEKTPTWNVGFITPKHDYLALVQGFEASDAWLHYTLNTHQLHGTRTIASLEWQYSDNRALGKETGNFSYALSTQTANGFIVLHGTASDDEFTTLAHAVAENLTTNEHQ